MPLHGDEIARERVGTDEWIVRFASLAIMDHVWNFTVYKADETRREEENLFWSPHFSGFATVGRDDIPPTVLARVEDWIRRTVRATK